MGSSILGTRCHPAANRRGSLQVLNVGSISAVSARFHFFLIAIFVLSPPLSAQRRPVLPQIDLPHPYYYRELYLPQLTSGPSSVAWAPDSKEVVYSMGGSLWRQKLDSTEAIQITDGAGYDYQPDWSPDGKSIVYVSYQKDAMELWLLDVGSGKSTQLTSGGAVNVEPRWSPDGKRIVFVSTQFNKRFHIFRADAHDGKLENIVRLTGETRSDLRRYYYSQYNMEINPVWTRDGEEILFISNNGHIHGTGGFWRMKAEPAAAAREIHYEETSWKARPDFSPDGSRMVYSSYLAGQWHNLWLMPAHGGDAFPISYGDWDQTCVRWSPDGKRLALISNQHGNTELWLQDSASGHQAQLAINHRRYVKPTDRIVLRIVDPKGNQIPGRVSITGDNGKFYAPQDAWIQADDGFDRRERPFEAHYFYSSEKEELEVPASPEHLTFEVVSGYERPLAVKSSTVTSGRNKVVTLQVSEKWTNDFGDAQWVCGDLHLHMNYGGSYRNNPEHLIRQAHAEGVSVVNNLIVNKEQRFPDIAYRGNGIDAASTRETEIAHGQEFHTSYWGHRGLLGIKQSILLPGYAGYPNTAAASLFPMNADVYDMAHAQGALVGAVHPFDQEPNPFATPAQRITDELPVDVALGKLDYMEIVGFSDHKSTAAVWYRLLNLGFRIPAGAGTDATTSYAAPIRGNVGFDRVYVEIPAGPLNLDVWMNSLKNGKTFVTNGPLIHFTLNGKMVASELKLASTQKDVPFTARLRSIVPVDHLEVVCNGKVVKELKLEGTRDSADAKGTILLNQSGWCVLRAYSDRPVYPVLDNYAYATTSPVYVTVAGQKPSSPDDAKYFAAWIARTIDITSAYPDWNSPQEKELVMKRLGEAMAIYEKME
jgi:TolB protein